VHFSRLPHRLKASRRNGTSSRKSPSTPSLSLPSSMTMCSKKQVPSLMTALAKLLELPKYSTTLSSNTTTQASLRWAREANTTLVLSSRPATAKMMVALLVNSSSSHPSPRIRICGTQPSSWTCISGSSTPAFRSSRSNHSMSQSASLTTWLPSQPKRKRLA